LAGDRLRRTRPITGRKREKSVTVATRAEAKQAEARLITEVGTGQHRATSNRTVAELLERWLGWRQSIRPISPTTIATYRGYIERATLPTPASSNSAGSTPPPWTPSTCTCASRAGRVSADGGQQRPSGPLPSSGSEEGNGRARYWSPTPPIRMPTSAGDGQPGNGGGEGMA